jgi:exosortase E/protease (VPEID-CTERM system)
MRWPHALLLLPLGAAAALVANVLRIASLVLLGAAGHTVVAVSGFHSKAGWAMFLLVSFGCIAAAERLRWFRNTAPGGREEATLPAAAAAYVSPLLAALVAALVTGMWTTGPADPLYAVRIAVGGAVLWSVRGALPRPALPSLGVPILAGGAVAAIWIAWPGAPVEGVRAAIEGWSPLERWGWIAARLVGSCTIVPLIEELAFRGFLLPWVVSPELDRPDPRRWTWPAVLLSSLAFGLLHREMLLGTIAGAAFAAARLWRGRLADAVLAHAAANAAIAAAVLLAGRWDLWPQ